MFPRTTGGWLGFLSGVMGAKADIYRRRARRDFACLTACTLPSPLVRNGRISAGCFALGARSAAVFRVLLHASHLAWLRRQAM